MPRGKGKAAKVAEDKAETNHVETVESEVTTTKNSPEKKGKGKKRKAEEPDTVVESPKMSATEPSTNNEKAEPKKKGTR